jgi:hypothetical protein
MEDWNAIAAEIDAAIRSVGDVSQPDGYPATLRKRVITAADPYDPDSGSLEVTYTTLRIIEDNRRLRDQNGTLIDETLHTIMVGTGAGVEPTDEDALALGVTAGEANDASAWIQITEVMPLAPAGVTILFELTLAS